MSDFVWAPDAGRIERANVTRLMRRLDCSDYHALHRLSIEDPERFWPVAVDDLDIEV